MINTTYISISINEAPLSEAVGDEHIPEGGCFLVFKQYYSWPQTATIFQTKKLYRCLNKKFQRSATFHVDLTTKNRMWTRTLISHVVSYMQTWSIFWSYSSGVKGYALLYCLWYWRSWRGCPLRCPVRRMEGRPRWSDQYVPEQSDQGRRLNQDLIFSVL